MNDKKDMIVQIIEKTELKEKIDAAFTEFEEEAKARLMEELENALREKLREEVDKRSAQIKKKARKRTRKALLSAALIFCSGLVILNLDRILPYLKKLK